MVSRVAGSHKRYKLESPTFFQYLRSYFLIFFLFTNLFSQFEIDHLNNEHLVCVEGYYDDESGVIQALQFKTNIKTSELLGYKKGKKFSLVDKRKKIVGFHGYADKNLNSLGAYFTTVSPTKSECYGSSKGIYWDDGVFDFIRTVYVSSNVMNVRCIKFHYYNRAVVVRQHGWNSIVEEDGEKEVIDPANSKYIHGL